ncbi:hypothetical protein GGR92_000013 [Spirosoma lacussanchae]|uniref:hypothetical protein n=1 Tax=Spirosoma lacussanchae TaxID=1884249 RepID=UPI00110851A9|nr:hypothetical protein [Spirosoma lacussanchae]
MNAIDPRDLMVGAYVMYEGQPFKVDDISLVQGVSLSAGYNFICDVSFARLQPIPITPEWLERLGYTERAALGGMKYTPSQGEAEVYYYRSKDSYRLLICSEQIALTSVHHLQVLVWHTERVALTLPNGQSH